MNLNFKRVFVAILSLLVVWFCIQKVATYGSGIFAFTPILFIITVIGAVVFFHKAIFKWFGFSMLIFCSFFTSCNFVPSDKIGVRVESYGKTPEDYNIVYGKFPADYSGSSWNLEFSGKSFGIPIDGFTVYSKDGVGLWADPSVLIELIRSNEACRKYAFKLSAYKNDDKGFEQAVSQIVLKETLDAVRENIGGVISDSIIFNRSKYETKIQKQLTEALNEKYGVNLSQFSVVIAPPQNLQDAINNRLTAQEQTKTTLASLENEKAKLQIASIVKERQLLESVGLTPSILEKMRIEYSYNAWITLAQSQNKVFVSGTPLNFLQQ